MKKIRIGFFKTPQGVFSEVVIKKIEEKIKTLPNVELFTGLDFREGVVVNGRVYVGDFDLNTLDIYFWHDSVRPTDWGGDNLYLNILKALENDCLVINTSEATKITNDKYLAHLVLAKNNLPVADFSLVDITNKNLIIKAFNDLGGSVLVKPRFGGWGIGISKFDNVEDLISATEMMISFFPNKKQQILLEKFYENDISKWTSVVVVGERTVFGYRKKNTGNTDWKIYDPEKKDGKGGDSEYVEVSEELREIAIKAKKSIGKDIIGFDFIYTKDGYKIIDENARPGIYPQCLIGAGINIEDEIVNLISSKIKQ